jgi:hypothetical protein
MPCSPAKVNRGFGETYRLRLQGQRVSQARNHIKQTASRARRPREDKRRTCGRGGTRTTGVMMFSCLVVGTHTSTPSLLFSTCTGPRDLPSLVLILYKVSFVKYGDSVSYVLFLCVTFVYSLFLSFVRDLPQNSIRQCGRGLNTVR